MSNIEHLIENAIACLDENKSFEDFVSIPVNKTMIEMVKSPADEIWQIAIYVKYTYGEDLRWKIEDEIERKYGYPIPE